MSKTEHNILMHLEKQAMRPYNPCHFDVTVIKMLSYTTQKIVKVDVFNWFKQ